MYAKLNQNNSTRYIKVNINLMEDKSLKATEILIISIIESYVRKGQCYVSNDYLGKLLKMSASQASRIISKLVKSGYIVSSIENHNRRLLTLGSKAQALVSSNPVIKIDKPEIYRERDYKAEYTGLKNIKEILNMLH